MGKQANLIFKTFDQSYEATVNDALVGDFTAAEGDEAPAKRDLSKYHHLDDVEFIDIDSKVEAVKSKHGKDGGVRSMVQRANHWLWRQHGAGP